MARTQRKNYKSKTRLHETSPSPTSGFQRHLQALSLPDAQEYRRWCQEQGFPLTLRKDWRQRRVERLRAQRLRGQETLQIECARHIQSLQLPDAGAYAAWCRQHDFSLSLHKEETRREQERQVAMQERAERALAEARRLSRQPDELIRAIYEQTVSWSALPQARLQKVHQLFARVKAAPRTRRALLRLLIHVWHDTELGSVQPAIAHLGLQDGNTFLDGLLALARRERDWRRDPEDWKPDAHNANRQFASLARHLLAQYDVPAFLDAAWFEGDSPLAERHRRWFVYVGAGGNLRHTDVPFTLTRRAAHCCLKAPHDLPLHAALRWGQARSLGASALMARALAASRLGDTLPDEPFWNTVMHFFVNHPTLNLCHISPLVDYIYHQKFAAQEMLEAEGGMTRLGPSQPDFTMRGRSPEVLLRQMQAWHRQLALETRRPARQWGRSGVGEYHLLQREEESGVLRQWTIRELLSSRELQEEGRAMRNCVATYAEACQSGHCSIWSLRLMSAEAKPRSLMTIEVDPRRRVVEQARGRCNQLPGGPKASPRLKTALMLLRRWTEQEGLTLDAYAC